MSNKLTTQDLVFITLGLDLIKDRPDCSTHKVNETIERVNKLLLEGMKRPDPNILQVGKPKKGDTRPAIQEFGWNTLTPSKDN